MNRWLAVGYLLTLLIAASGILVVRGFVPQLDELSSHILSQSILALHIPAAVPLLVGAKRSVGNLRRGLGFLTSCLNLLMGVGSLLAALLLAAGVATPVDS